MGQISNQLVNDIQQCKLCSTITGHKKFLSTIHGQLSGRYLLVSEAPGKISLSRQQYWTGVGGQILRSCTAAADTTLEKLFYLTDIVKCWPSENDNNRPPLESEIKNCSRFLTKEIDELSPDLILCFGKPASSYLLGREVKVKTEHGNIYDYNNTTKIIVLLHPTGIDRQTSRNIYTNQLTSLFRKLKDGRHNEINEIFG